MDIETGARMIVEFSGKKRMNCSYVGQVQDEFVLLQVPMSPGIRNRLRPGTYLQFRFLRNGRIIGFGAEILSYQASPASLVFISYPSEFSQYNLRQEDRVQCRFPATLSVMGHPHSGSIVDISPNGCRFVFDGIPTPATEEKMPVSGYFSTMEGRKTYDFKGTVMLRRTRGGEQGAWHSFHRQDRFAGGAQGFLSGYGRHAGRGRRIAQGRQIAVTGRPPAGRAGWAR